MNTRTFSTLSDTWRSATGGLAFLVLAGCGDSSTRLTTAESKAFDSAPAELKQQWEQTLAADKANNYSTVQTLLDGLANQQLSENQKLALEKERADFGQRLWAAAEKNDPAATKAVQDSRKPRSQSRGLPVR